MEVIIFQMEFKFTQQGRIHWDVKEALGSLICLFPYFSRKEGKRTQWILLPQKTLQYVGRKVLKVVPPKVSHFNTGLWINLISCFEPSIQAG